jgi:hypothetical protein
MALAAAAALLGAALAAPASALPDPIIPEGGDDTDCLDRSFVAGDLQAQTDATDGNFWVRRDTFTLVPNNDQETCFSAYVSGISLIVKTPLQITSTPDWDDLDAGNNSSPDLRAAMAGLWPDFHPEWGTAFYNEAGNGPPSGAFANIFQGAEFCLSVGSSITIASCLGGTPTSLTDIGGGFMIFTIELGDDSFYLDAFEGDEFFDLVSIVHSDVLGPLMIGNNNPEMVIGWRFVGFEPVITPEPSLVLLLVPALLLALRRRAS